MIEVGYLVDSKGAQKFGTCASCGKGSDDDPKMVRVTYSHHDSISRTSNCLCADCRRLLLKTIRDGIKDEPTAEPTVQPEIIRCKDCKHYLHDEEYGFGRREKGDT